MKRKTGQREADKTKKLRMRQKGASNSQRDREGKVQRVCEHVTQGTTRGSHTRTKLYLISLNLPHTHSQPCAGEVSLGIPMLKIQK